MKKHLSMAVLVLFIAAQSFASITYLNRATPGTMLNSGKYNQNLTWIEDKFDNGIDSTDLDTGAVVMFASGALPTTSGDTQFGSYGRMAFYYRDMPDTAEAEDTITHGLGSKPLFVYFFRVAPDTYVSMPRHVRSDDTYLVIKSACSSDSERILVIY